MTSLPMARLVCVALGLSILLGVCSAGGNKLVCYYQRTSYFRASSIPGGLCTHVIYAFGTITSTDIAPPTSSQQSEWNTMTSLRQQYPELKIMLSLQRDFNLVVGSDKSRMEQFAANAVAYLRKYQFDGVDMDWEFPKSSQKTDFATFFQIMREAMEKEAEKNGGDQLLLSLALPNNQKIAAASYDLTSISSNVDFATAMAYDFHLYVKDIDTKTGYNSPLYTTPGDSQYYSASAMAKFYITAGFSSEKLLLGVPTYGRSWTLSDSSNHGLHAPATGKGAPGPYRHIKGVYTVPDTCTALDQGAKSVRDTDLGAVYLYKDTTWVAYDDVGTVKQKAQWAQQTGLGGVGVWSLALDDASNVCGAGAFPLLEALKGVLLGDRRRAVDPDFPDASLYFEPEPANRIHSV